MRLKTLLIFEASCALAIAALAGYYAMHMKARTRSERLDGRTIGSLITPAGGAHPAMVAVAVNATPIGADFILVGSRVDVVDAATQHVILRDVLVLPVPGDSVTLYMTPDQAALLAPAQRAGTLRLVPRGGGLERSDPARVIL